ncbi:hypothetical protein [Bradyrhizobium sp. USDA 4350]
MIFRAGMRLVVVHEQVTVRIDRYLRIPENATEAGGILIGCYRGPHIEITDCSLPLRRDRRARLRFDRDDPGHQGLANRRWTESGRTHTFVGGVAYTSQVFVDAIRDRSEDVARGHAEQPLWELGLPHQRRRWLVGDHWRREDLDKDVDRSSRRRMTVVANLIVC